MRHLITCTHTVHVYIFLPSFPLVLSHTDTHTHALAQDVTSCGITMS